MASVTFKSGNASSGGNNASGALILQTGLNYGTGASTITFKTRTAGADTSTPGDPQDTLILNTANEVVVNEGKLKLGSTLVTATAAELNVLDGVTAGTATASKAVVLDANKDIGTIRNLTIDGTFSDGNYTFDTSGNVSGLGTVGCGAITSSGNLAVTGTITGDTSLTLDSTTITTAEIGVLDGVTAGTATASKALVLDANKDIATIRNLTIDGTFSDGNYTFDTSGNVSGLGTVGCGAITSTGDMTIFDDANNADTSLSMGTSATEALVVEVLNGAANKTAEEIKFTSKTESATADHGKFTFAVDESNKLEINDSGINVTGTITGDTSLTLDSTTITTAEIGVLDGVTAGTAAASKALVLDANKDIATIRNLTIDGTFSDGNYTFDTSGNVSGLGTVGCGAITSTGNLAVTGTITGDTSLTLDSTTITTAEIGVLDGVTAGTATASKALVLDASKNIATIGTIGCGAITSTGTSSFAGGITPASADGAALGSSDKEWSDLYLADSSVIYFGADSEITLTHVHNEGLALKHTATADNNPIKLTLQTGETDIQINDKIGVIDFQAPDEGTGTDAILVCAGIEAVSEGDFSAGVNATKLSFKTAASEAATEKMSLSSSGELTVSGGITVSSGSTTLAGTLTVQGVGGLAVQGIAGLQVGLTSTNTGTLILHSAGSANATTISAHTNATGAATYYLPAADGSANQVLKTDGSGNLSWVAQGSGGTIDGLSDAKKGGANFGGSLLIGRTNTGTLSTALNNIGIGFSSVNATSGPFRVLSSGKKNVAIGAGNCANALSTGSVNTIIGFDAGSSLSSGTSNVIIGGSAGLSITTQSSNVIIGSGSGPSITTKNNTIVGTYSAASITTGSNNTIIGANCGNTLNTNCFNNTLIGYGATASATNANNEITLGNSNITELRCADTTISSLSDARDKTDVIDLPWGLDFVDSLRPVQFTWDRRVLTPEDENWAMNGKKRAGFLAQELQTAMTDNANDVLDLVYESNPERLEVKMGKLVPMLTQAIKELKAEVDTLKAEVAALKNA